MGSFYYFSPSCTDFLIERGDFPALFKALHSLDNIVKTAELKPTDLAHYYVYRVVAFKDAGNFEGMYAELQANRNQIKDEVFYY